MILKDFPSLRPRAVFCRVIFVKQKSVLASSENRESGSTASVKNVLIDDRCSKTI